jgi:hypothetical protein
VRTLIVDSKGKLTITDEMTAGASDCRVRWTLCTPATPRVLSCSEIELEQGGKKMLLRVVSPTKGIEPFVLPNTPRRSFDTDNRGTLRVGFYTNIPHEKSQTLRVELLPVLD